MKKKILIVGPYLPGKAFGGPVKSLVNIIETLNSQYDFSVLTQDRDLNSATPYKSIRVGEWNKLGNANVYYIPINKSGKHIYNILSKEKFDLIYLNSFFSKSSIVIQFMKLIGLIKNPILLAPRGEFSPGALDIKSFKKKTYLFFYKKLKMQKNTIYTSNLEKDKKFIEKTLGNNITVHTANNIVVNENFKEIIKPYKNKGELKIVTVSRIAPIKNLDYSLKVLKSIDESNKEFGSIVFDIYGPLEDDKYWNMCKTTIDNISDKISINYKGPLDYEKVIDVLSNYHMFLLPTQGENFGHVIQEALLAACPVIISDQTPWRHLSKENVGFDFPLRDNSAFINGVEYFVDLNEDEYNSLSQSAYNYGRYQVENQQSIIEHKEMFEKVIISKGRV